VKIVGWIIAGFFTPGPELDIEQQAWRNYERVGEKTSASMRNVLRQIVFHGHFMGETNSPSS
jgi:hypothetical protein